MSWWYVALSPPAAVTRRSTPVLIIAVSRQSVTK